MSGLRVTALFSRNPSWSAIYFIWLTWVQHAVYRGRHSSAAVRSSLSDSSTVCAVAQSIGEHLDSQTVNLPTLKTRKNVTDGSQ